MKRGSKTKQKPSLSLNGSTLVKRFCGSVFGDPHASMATDNTTRPPPPFACPVLLCVTYMNATESKRFLRKSCPDPELRIQTVLEGLASMMESKTLINKKWNSMLGLQGQPSKLKHPRPPAGCLGGGLLMAWQGHFKLKVPHHYSLGHCHEKVPQSSKMYLRASQG